MVTPVELPEEVPPEPSPQRVWHLAERIALIGTILVWLAVFVAAAGLYIIYREEHPPVQEVAAQADPTATATATSTPTAAIQRRSTPIIDWGTGTGSPPTSYRTPTSSPTATPTATRRPPPTPSTPTPTPTPSPPPPADAPPDRIVIPSIDLDAPVVPVGWHLEEIDGQQTVVWDVADYAAGWHNTSALPGHQGNCVLSGHNNTRGEVFRDLVNVQEGDLVVLYVNEVPYYYRVTERHILKQRGVPPEVRRENAKWIGPTEDERLTLVTCWPVTSNTHRLIVVARPVDPATLSASLPTAHSQGN